LFAGVALDGSALTIDHRSNEQFYGRTDVLASEIIRTDAATAPAPAQTFVGTLQRSTTGAAASNRSAPAPTQPAQPAQPANPGSLTTYPMEDPKPGQEPPP
jgi:hypothetical protein